MKHHSIYILLIIGLFVVIGCRGGGSGSPSITNRGELTPEKAQRTLTRWMKNDGQVTVRGIQEFPKENAAKANLTFSGFKFNDNGNQRTYSGPGFAVFTRYNDGRWVMTKVSTDQGFQSIWWDNLNVEAN